MLVKPSTPSDGEIEKRYNSIFSYDYHLRLGDFHFSPSLYYLGMGAGAGYIFKENTVISASIGGSIYPETYGSGLSISESFNKNLFLTYAFNLAQFNHETCIGICYLEDEGSLVDYHHFSAAVLISKLIYIDFRADMISTSTKNIAFGVTFGPYLGQ